MGDGAILRVCESGVAAVRWRARGGQHALAECALAESKTARRLRTGITLANLVVVRPDRVISIATASRARAPRLEPYPSPVGILGSAKSTMTARQSRACPAHHALRAALKNTNRLGPVLVLRLRG